MTVFSMAYSVVQTKKFTLFQKEYDRIEAAGGALLTIQGELRINGMLNVSRSLGEYMYPFLPFLLLRVTFPKDSNAQCYAAARGSAGFNAVWHGKNRSNSKVYRANRS